jgi:hypothetical protein
VNTLQNLFDINFFQFYTLSTNDTTVISSIINHSQKLFDIKEPLFVSFQYLSPEQLDISKYLQEFVWLEEVINVQILLHVNLRGRKMIPRGSEDHVFLELEDEWSYILWPKSI